MNSNFSAVTIVESSLRRPVTILVAFMALAIFGMWSVRQMPRDILPNLGVPTIYVAQPFGGMSASQMESYVTYYYEYHFLYLTGISSVESKNVASTALIKLEFHRGMDMAQALSETIGYVNRARAFMPEGLVSPFVMRFDAGGAPVGKLVFSTKNPDRTLPELQSLALNSVRPLFATLPGVSAPPPFGGSQRTILINVDPEKLKQFNLSPGDVGKALATANKILPSGNLLDGDMYPSVSLNSLIKNINELDEVPLRVGTYPTVFIKDVAKVIDGSDIATGYALVNGKRTVYIPVTKRADASTMTVVNLVKDNMAKFQSVLPDDVTVSYEFDQSGVVSSSIFSVVLEGIVGALLASIMSFLFLRSVRSALVVVISIPLSLLFSLILLWLSNQTINIMTLGGLALSIGVLVDEITVTIENIHRKMEEKESTSAAILNGANEVLKPAFLTMLCLLAVFLPSFFMEGTSKALFVPLSLSVGFSVLGSFIISRTLVPVLLNYFYSHNSLSQLNLPSTLSRPYTRILNLFLNKKLVVIVAYVAIVAILLASVPLLRRELFPKFGSAQIQLKLRAQPGTALQKMETLTLKSIDVAKSELGDTLASSVSFVGMQPPSYPINTIHQWSSGTHESVVDIELKKTLSSEKMEELQERLREKFKNELPEVSLSFAMNSLMEKILSSGTTTPIEINIFGPKLPESREFAKKIYADLATLPYIRDLHYGQSFEYPAIEVKVDRRKAGLLGLTMVDVGNSLVPATSSSRYLIQNYWADPKSGVNFQVQVQVPQGTLKTAEDLKRLPVTVGNGAISLDQFTEFNASSLLAETERLNMQRVVTIKANLRQNDLGHASEDIQARIQKLLPERPKGVEVKFKGQVPQLKALTTDLVTGILVSTLIIYLLLVAHFQSFRLPLVILATTPGTLAGVVLLLQITGTSINMESFMGTIMSLGVSIANAILLISFCEEARSRSSFNRSTLIQTAQNRLRPIVMTSLAMIMGMLPLAVSMDSGGHTASLAIAMIGGLLLATPTTLFVLPAIYQLFNRKETQS